MSKDLDTGKSSNQRKGGHPVSWLTCAGARSPLLLELLASECTNPQGLRDLTVTGLGPIDTFGRRTRGPVVWNIAVQSFEYRRGSVSKLPMLKTPSVLGDQSWIPLSGRS
jgi:hypothetical protein